MFVTITTETLVFAVVFSLFFPLSPTHKAIGHCIARMNVAVAVFPIFRTALRDLFVFFVRLQDFGNVGCLLFVDTCKKKLYMTTHPDPVLTGAETAGIEFVSLDT